MKEHYTSLYMQLLTLLVNKRLENILRCDNNPQERNEEIYVKHSESHQLESLMLEGKKYQLQLYFPHTCGIYQAGVRANLWP